MKQFQGPFFAPRFFLHEAAQRKPRARCSARPSTADLVGRPAGFDAVVVGFSGSTGAPSTNAVRKYGQLRCEIMTEFGGAGSVAVPSAGTQTGDRHDDNPCEGPVIMIRIDGAIDPAPSEARSAGMAALG